MRRAPSDWSCVAERVGVEPTEFNGPSLMHRPTRCVDMQNANSLFGHGTVKMPSSQKQQKPIDIYRPCQLCQFKQYILSADGLLSTDSAAVDGGGKADLSFKRFVPECAARCSIGV